MPGDAILEIVLVVLIIATIGAAAGYFVLYGVPSWPSVGGTSETTPAGRLPTPFPSIVDEAGFHTVRPGESLYGIAVANGLDPQDLRYWNSDNYPSLSSNAQVFVGWVLELSGPPRPTEAPEPEPTPVVAVASAEPGPAPAGLVALPSLSITVLNASVVYYAVEGTDPSELLASAVVSVDNPEHSEAAAYVETTFTFDYDFAAEPDGSSCEITTFSVDRTYEVTAPRWTAPAFVHPALLDWWGLILDHLAWHEEQHVRIYERGLASLETEVVGEPCESVQAVIDEAFTAIEAEQEAFDTTDYEWVPPDYTGPWDW
jgi:predicted secreted Zn-dependent protease